MMTIQLSGENGLGRTTIVDDDVAPLLLNKKVWYDGRGYAYISVGRTKQHLHRFILKPNKQELVDHINSDKLDNRRCNLRLCNRGQNLMNKGMHKRNKSGYKGVVKNNTKKIGWSAYIKSGDIRLNLGTFDTKELAAHAYNKAAIKYHGEFAQLNDIRS